MEMIGVTKAVALTTLTFTLSATPTWSQTILAEKISEVIKIENQTKKISVLNYLLYKILSFKNITHSILILLLGLGNSTSFAHLPKHSNHINQYAQNTRRYTISGSLELINLYGISGEGNNCFGRSGYQDIRGGTQIIVKDGSGKVLAIGKISNGRSPAGQYFQHICRFTFKISNISRTNFYSIKIGRRGEILYSYQDLVKQNWNVNLTLGTTKQELDESIRGLDNLFNRHSDLTFFDRLLGINRAIIPSSANQTNLSRRATCIRCNINYPEFARREGIEGRVEVAVDIDAKGDVTNVRLLRSSGNRRLDEEIKKQASNWKLQPSEGGRQGISIATNFTLEGSDIRRNNSSLAGFKQPISGHRYFNFPSRRDEMLVNFTEAIRINSNDADAYYNRGVVYAQQQKWDLALADFTQAIKLNPDDAEAYNNRGVVYRNQQKWDLALADFTQAIRINSNYALAYRNRGLVYRELRDINKAREDLQRAAELYRNQGNTFAYQKTIEAIRALNLL